MLHGNPSLDAAARDGDQIVHLELHIGPRDLVVLQPAQVKHAQTVRRLQHTPGQQQQQQRPALLPEAAAGSCWL